MNGPLHVVVGAGAVGSATAELLATQGNRVVLISRRGTDPGLSGVLAVAADASDASRLSEIATGAAAVYNCANPAYHRWPQDWPPIADSLLTTAERTGAVLVTLSNLYGYGPVDRPMTEDLPLAAGFPKGQVRARMWHDALAAHEAGRARVTEVRASDYIGPHSQSQFADRVVPAIYRGRGVFVLGRPDVPHTFTYTRDVARLMVSVATDERAWGRPWHVPSNEPHTSREVVTAMCDLAGRRPVPVRRLPDLLIRLGGLAVPLLRELADVRYQHDLPFVMDSSAALATFGLEPTPWQEVLAATVNGHRPAGAPAVPVAA
ncbi:MAG: NAD-dependent epimerase/dehydratase family protein [Kineosporiaceae bacterium]